MMNYILKIYHKSKYFNFKRYEYLEFNSYEEIYNFVNNHNLKSSDYEIYGKVIL